MPHIIVKLWPGRSNEHKTQLTAAIVRDVTNILHYGDDSVSVAFEEVPADDWTQKVYEPDIVGNWDSLTKKPNYGPDS